MTVSLDQGWRFEQSADVSGAESAQFDDSSWAKVAVPHTWNRLGNTGTERSPLSNNVQGVGWYRLKFRTPPAAVEDSKHYFLQLDAVGAIADVWLNGRYLGKHAGAFFVCGGIYREVSLIVTSAVQPTLHLVGRRYAQRPNAVLDVKAYSNAPRARLSLNGKDQGGTPCAGGVCLWRSVHLQPGKDTLTATADTASDSLEWTLEH